MQFVNRSIVLAAALACTVDARHGRRHIPSEAMEEAAYSTYPAPSTFTVSPLPETTMPAQDNMTVPMGTESGAAFTELTTTISEALTVTMTSTIYATDGSDASSTEMAEGGEMTGAPELTGEYDGSDDSEEQAAGEDSEYSSGVYSSTGTQTVTVVDAESTDGSVPDGSEMAEGTTDCTAVTVTETETLVSTIYETPGASMTDMVDSPEESDVAGMSSGTESPMVTDVPAETSTTPYGGASSDMPASTMSADSSAPYYNGTDGSGMFAGEAEDYPAYSTTASGSELAGGASTTTSAMSTETGEGEEYPAYSTTASGSELAGGASTTASAMSTETGEGEGYASSSMVGSATESAEGAAYTTAAPKKCKKSKRSTRRRQA